MEASVSVGPPPHERAAQSRLLRLGTDDQLVALFRSGYDEAFETIHDRYHAPLFGYARQLLRHSNADAEDAVQEVFWRASRSLRKDDREIVLRPWLYRVAHNYCFDQLRRPELQLCDLQDICRSPHRDPALEAEQRETFRRLVTDLERLPDQQRSALLMHIDGLTVRRDRRRARDLSVCGQVRGEPRAREPEGGERGPRGRVRRHPGRPRSRARPQGADERPLAPAPERLHGVHDVQG